MKTCQYMYPTSQCSNPATVFKYVVTRTRQVTELRRCEHHAQKLPDGLFDTYEKALIEACTRNLE